MRDVVVIGGGLSGLVACYELEKHDIHCTLIEVKPRLGGSINSVDKEDFIFDSAPMHHAVTDPDFFHTYLETLDLGDAIFTTGDREIAFKGGTGTLIDALAKRIKAPIMYRMAVSTLGSLDDTTFSICMENGMLLDARALVVAAPARYAERMMHTLVPEISHILLDYRYDHIAYVSLGYSDMKACQFDLTPPADYPITVIHQVMHPARAPEDSLTIQVGLRFEPENGLPADPVGQITTLMGWPPNPTADHIEYWPEGTPVMWRDPAHATRMKSIKRLLPDGVALCGNDYMTADVPTQIDDRIMQGIEAAEWIINTCKK